MQYIDDGPKVTGMGYGHRSGQRAGGVKEYDSIMDPERLDARMEATERSTQDPSAGSTPIEGCTTKDLEGGTHERS